MQLPDHSPHVSNSHHHNYGSTSTHDAAAAGVAADSKDDALHIQSHQHSHHD